MGTTAQSFDNTAGTTAQSFDTGGGMTGGTTTSGFWSKGVPFANAGIGGGTRKLKTSERRFNFNLLFSDSEVTVIVIRQFQNYRYI
jgi:hypothetical protein